MKWKDLSLKERKQIYDSVRVNNPDATYFDIKEQFDSIPTYEDGKGKTINKADLPPEYITGTPEYFERQRKISGAVNAVQPEAYITPAGYIKDAVNFIEDLGKGDYAGAAIDAALNLIPWGVGKTIKKIKKKVERAIEGIDAYTEADYDQESAEVKRKYNNMQEYEKELSKITNDLFVSNDGSIETLEKVDKAYGTNYKKAASAIAFQDMANRGKYVKHQQMYDSAGNPIYGRTTGKVEQPTIEDMTVSLNPDYYLEGTANHELSHLADTLVNKVHSADATNNYMEYLLDRDNIMSYNEIRQSLMDVNPSTYRYLTTPSENKAHMIQLKRGMQKEGIINNWTDPITQDKIEEYLSYRSKYANRVNPVLRTLYDIRPDKQGFINRMNNLTPIEWAAPLGLPMFFGEEQENK